ncbi:reverse transcriptase domain-containing protein [Tanacetum coccineum]
MEHRLNIWEGYTPVRQKKRGQAPERAKAIQAEVQKLVEAGIMREVHYHDWLSNPVMVKNMTVAGGCYHQIQMTESDEEKTAFHTSQGVYFYTKMSFGHKNDGGTYQRLVDKAFNSQVGRNVEVYVDDLVIKSYTKAEMLRDVDETFRTFLSKSAKKSLPLFKTLKKCIKKSDFHWIPEVEQAFKQLKQHLLELSLLVAPKPKEELVVYLSASYRAVSTVLMTKRGTVQTPVYFVSSALQGPELNYAPMEKLVLALVFAAKRLRRYFQAHPIMLKVQDLFSKGSNTRRTQYHVPAKDIRKRTNPSGFRCQEARQSTTRNVSGRDTSRAVDIIHGRVVMCRLVRRWPDTNKLRGNRITAQIGVHNLRTSVDSKLVANQVLGTYIAKEENMVKFLEKAKNLISGFANFSISQVPRSKNKKADALSKIASTIFVHLSKQILVEVLKEKSIHEKEVATVVEEEGPTWMTPIVEYLRDGTLPDDKKEASKLRIKARQYKLVGGILYRRSFLTPWLRCVGPLQVDYVIIEIHEGSYSMHAGPRSVVAKAMRLGHAMDGGKLGPKWEGPYEVTEALGDGAYRVRSLEGTVLPQTWNIANLKKYYL